MKKKISGTWRKIAFLGGLILLPTFAFAGAEQDQGWVQVEDRRSFGMDGIGSLVISYTSARVTFRAVEGEELILIERRRNTEPATVLAEGGVLSITGDRRGWTFFTRRRLAAEIGIPRSYQGDYRLKAVSGSIRSEGELSIAGIMSITVSSGSIALEKLSARSIELRSSSGSIHAGELIGQAAITLSSGSLNLGSLTGERHTISSSSGSIEADRISGSTEIQASSGFMKIGSLEGEYHRLSSSSGSIEVRALGGSADFTAHSGSVTVDTRRLSGNLSFDVRSGSLDLRLPKEAAFNLDAETSSGRVRVQSPDEVYSSSDRASIIRPIGQDPRFTIYARARSGNIDIFRTL